ncbi:MAG: transporter substrate-binding domain-containing protein [Gammaproteobacteria bacterium]|nr:transporter substrate-binding domain-containing protein [Gammaproteobacteria bacterium]
MFKSVTIRVNLLTYFILAVAFSSGLILSLQYKFSYDLAYAAADRTFTQVGEKLSVFIAERDRQLKMTLDLIALDKRMEDHIAPGAGHEGLRLFAQILEDNPNLYAVYVGKDNGDFYELIDMQRERGLHEYFKAAAEVRWTVIKIGNFDGKRSRHLEFLDENLRLLDSRSEASEYDPRTRPWYALAKAAKEVVRTEPYLFSMIKAPGVTFAKTLESGKGVLAMDITTTNLNAFLAEQRFAEGSAVFLFNRHGEKYASSSPMELAAASKQELREVEPLALTDAEKAFIAERPQMRVANSLNRPPLDYASRGNPRGYAVDLLDLIARKAGMRVQYLNGLSDWTLEQLFFDEKIDLLNAVSKNPERASAGIFSDLVVDTKPYLISRKDAQLASLEALAGKTLALPKGSRLKGIMQARYPQVQVLELNQMVEVYQAVAGGRADALIDSELSLRYYTGKFSLARLHLGPVLEDMRPADWQLYFLLQPGLETLQGILNKGLASLTEAEKQWLWKRWAESGCSNAGNCEELALDQVPPPMMRHVGDKASGLISFRVMEQDYFGYSAPLTSVGTDGGLQIGMSVPAKAMLDPFLDKVHISLLVGSLAILLVIPGVFFITRRILRPIRDLMVENHKISERRYTEVALVKTNIREFASLSNSLIDMAGSIKAYEKAQEELMESFIKLIVNAIDAKSPYTGGHCNRVPEIAEQLARAATRCPEGIFADFALTSDDEWREFRMGALLHDCGKVTTPEYVVDKATKLETITNRIHEIRMRFEVLWRDLELECLERQRKGEDIQALNDWLVAEQQQLQDDFAFIAECNIGGEFMSDDKIERLQRIAQRTWLRYFDDRLGLSDLELQLFQDRPPENLPVTETLLSDRPEHLVPRYGFNPEVYAAEGFKLEVPEYLYNRGELYNLSIRRGTLTAEDRFKINDHVIQTIHMLEQLPFPEQLKRIPEYAGTHHETLIGTGYPRKLTAAELSIPARIMALADVFEALTASDRPYKKAKTLSEAIKIMGFMVKDQHIDAEVFKLFLRSGVYLDYARATLLPEQLDEVDVAKYLAG